MSVREAIEQSKHVLTVEMIEQLDKLLTILSEDASNKSKSIAFELLARILIEYQTKRMNEVDIMVWIGKLPFEVKKMPRVCIKIIAVLLIEKEA